MLQALNANESLLEEGDGDSVPRGEIGSVAASAPSAGSAGAAGQNASGVTQASVPFMITQAQTERLRQLGKTDDEIRNMTPEEAHKILSELWGSW